MNNPARGGKSVPGCWPVSESFEVKLTRPGWSFLQSLVIAFGRQDGRFTLDLGAGFALLSKPAYTRQDFGGALQFALTLGLSVPLYERIGVGYRFQHYSDGGAYGHEKTGVDFHMIELTYRF